VPTASDDLRFTQADLLVLRSIIDSVLAICRTPDAPQGHRALLSFNLESEVTP
jgi:hypothetical protein